MEISQNRFVDPDATFVGTDIDTTKDMAGGCVFVEVPDQGVMLVEIDELIFYRDKQGHTFSGVFHGRRVMGNPNIEGIRVDQRKLAEEYSWQRVSRLDDLSFPGEASRAAVQFNTLRFRKLRTNGFDMLVVSRMDGYDKMLDQALVYQVLSLGDLLCPGTPVFKCTNTACDSRCNVIINSNWIDDCNCPGLIFCNWVPQGSQCWNLNCTATCNNITGWSAACPCY